MTFIINLFFLATFLPTGITFFSMKIRKASIAVTFFFLGVLLCTIIEKSVHHPSPLLFPLSFLCIAITLFAMFKTTFKVILLSELLSYVIISLFYQIASVFCSQLSIDTSTDNSYFSLVQSIIIFLLIFSFSIFFNTTHDSKNHLSLSYLAFLTIIVIIDGTVVVAIGVFLFAKMGISNVRLGLSIYILLILGILIQIILLIYMIKSRELHKENERQAKQYLENQTRYYEYLVQREEDTKKFRHDIRNHINMLNILFQENKIDECKNYLKDLTTHYDNISCAISVNNCIADAILNKYFYETKNHNIKLNVIGHFPSECNLPAYDICTIYSNLLENALTAVIACNGKEIEVGCRYTETEVLLSIENDSDYVVLDADGMPRTIKNDVSQHGFGLKNVQQCVTQNSGHMSIQTTDKRFKVILSLNRGIENESSNNR